VLNEPSIVAVNNVSDEIEAVGSEAKEMLGRTPGSITAIRPMRDGVIADFEAAEKMLGYFIKKAHRRKAFVRPARSHRRALRDHAGGASRRQGQRVSRQGERRCTWSRKGWRPAIGAGLPITEASGNMIVDIGGGTTDIAVISLAGVVYSKSVRVAGNAMDDAIASVRQARARPADRRADGGANQDRARLGGAARRPARDGSEGSPRPRRKADDRLLHDGQIRERSAEPVRQIVQAVRDCLERIPPELSADVYDRGIVLSGGGALLHNLDERLRHETGLPVSVAEDPLSSVVLGAGKMLSDFKLLRIKLLAIERLQCDSPRCTSIRVGLDRRFGSSSRIGSALPAKRLIARTVMSLSQVIWHESRIPDQSLLLELHLLAFVIRAGSPLMNSMRHVVQRALPPQA
jgi:rod shape-determining protein MreB